MNSTSVMRFTANRNSKVYMPDEGPDEVDDTPGILPSFDRPFT